MEVVDFTGQELEWKIHLRNQQQLQGGTLYKPREATLPHSRAKAQRLKQSLNSSLAGLSVGVYRFNGQFATQPMQARR